MSDENTQTQNEEDSGLIAYMFTNDRQASWRLQPFLDMLYRGAFENTLGIMEALNKETDEVELLIVGIEHNDNGTTSNIPIARVLDINLAAKYLAPDGKGGWLDNPLEEVDVN